MYDAEGADELVFLDITASHEQRDLVFEMASARGREGPSSPSPLAEVSGTLTTSGAWSLPGPTRSRSIPPPSPTPAWSRRAPEPSGPSASWSPSTPSPGVTGVGRYLSTAAENLPDWTRSSGPAKWKSGGGEILLTSMDRDGTRDGYDIPLTRAICEAVRYRSSPRRGRKSRPSAGSDRAGGSRCRSGCIHLPLRRIQHGRDQAFPRG